MKVPILDIITKFIENGLAKKKLNRFGSPVISGVPCKNWQNLSLKELVIRYKAILNDILNYYSFVNNKSRFGIIYWILLSSLAKTIAQKLKMKSMKRVFKKYGKDLSKISKEVNFPEFNL